MTLEADVQEHDCQAHFGLGGIAIYDICDDKALPNLQTATHKENAHRYRSVHLR
jgi:hypothetical protein